MFDSHARLTAVGRRELDTQLADPLKQILLSPLPTPSTTSPKHPPTSERKKNSVKSLAFCNRNHRKTPIAQYDSNALTVETVANELGRLYSSGVGRLCSLDIKPVKPGSGAGRGGGRANGSELAAKLSLFG